ncbi:MAG: NAD(P)H-dependent oxidoreductase [Pseudomonadota bacterium]
MKIVVIVGHPNADSFCEALALAYARGAKAMGHEVDVINLRDLQFDPVSEKGFDLRQPLDSKTFKAVGQIGRAEHSVWIWPVLLGARPALLQGFVERLFQSDAIRRDQGFTARKSARIIVTLPDLSWLERLFVPWMVTWGFSRQFLRIAGFTRVRRCGYPCMNRVGGERRDVWLSEVERLGRRAV